MNSELKLQPQNLIDTVQARQLVSAVVVILLVIFIVVVINGWILSPRRQKKAWAEQSVIKMFQEIRGLRDYITRITVSETTTPEIKVAIRQSLHHKLFWSQGEIHTPEPLSFESFDKILRVCDYRHLNCHASLKWATGVFRLFFDYLEAPKRDVEYLQYFLRHLGELVYKCPECIVHKAHSWDEIELCIDGHD
jgi:hypothetical protein